MTMTSKKKQFILAALLLAANISAFAQGNGMAGITEATSMVTSYRGHQGLWQVLVRRPGHEQDRRKLVRSLYLPDCKCNHPALVLPVNRRFPYIIR